MSAPVIATSEAGHGDTSVFMLHGIGGGKQAFAPTINAIGAAGFHAIAWDMPGYGGSEMIAPYSMETLARALLSLIEAKGAKRNIVLGHSMGGMVAQEAAALSADAIDGLILSGTSPSFGKPDGNWQRDFIAARTAPLDAGLGMAAMGRELAPNLVAAHADAAVVAQAAEIMAQVPEASYRAALAAIVRFDRLAQLSAIRVPVLAIAGRHDKQASPQVMEKMAARIADCEYVCIEDAGHLACMETPAAFNAATLAFLNKHFS
jgi:3-oxoadipate enol-lactonase